MTVHSNNRTRNKKEQLKVSKSKNAESSQQTNTFKQKREIYRIFKARLHY